MTTNGAGLLEKNTVLAQLGVSKATMERYIKRGDLPIAKRVNRGYGKLSPMFEPQVVESLRARRQGLSTPALPAQDHVSTPDPPAPAPHPSRGHLVTAMHTLHACQATILTTLEQPSPADVEAEMWALLLNLTRSQERLLSEVLLDTPLVIVEQTE